MIRKADLKIAKICSKDSARPVLTSVCLSYEKNKLKLSATDGYKLTEKLVEVDYTPDFEKILVPSETLSAVMGLMTAKDSVEVYKDKFIVNDKDGIEKRVVEMGRLIEGTFPEYDSLVPDENPKTTIVLDRKYLQEALAVADSTVKVQLEVDEDGTVIRTKPIQFRSESYDSTTLSVVMPLKS